MQLKGIRRAYMACLLALGLAVSASQVAPPGLESYLALLDQAGDGKSPPA